MYPLADAPCKELRKQPAAPTTSGLQKETKGTFHGSLRDTSSGRLELLRYIGKTHELIRFVGCKTHHDLSVGLRMLTPYTDSSSDLYSRTPSSQKDSVLATATGDDIPIRHLPSNPLLVQDIAENYQKYGKRATRSRAEVSDNGERATRLTV
ncbi:hypothetical protein QFC20_002969 [Naganishia adeliensis]|uniref:Uncharacterized protein n=1 Tax=Naganishia adeliensis TaxID=92952 RepID=A0ACC2WIH8_9TREE|nr:hypothetical protein QFC20_002969 [Naganishia adeliensis]